RILTEAVGIAAGARAAGGLAEEYVVTVGAIDQDAIRGAALAAEGKVAAAGGITDYAWREHGEVEEIAAVDGKVADRSGTDGGGGFSGHFCIGYRGATRVGCGSIQPCSADFGLGEA